MRKRIVFFLALLFILFSANTSQAQISKGKDFWFGFLKNLVTPGVTREDRVYITSEVPASGVISSPQQGWSQAFTVTPGVSTKIVVPDNISVNYDVDAIGTKALHVVTTECVSVFTHDFEEYTSDAAVIYPNNSLGNDYMVTSYWSTILSIATTPEFLIVAAEGPTQLSITLPISTQGHTAGVPYTITLDTGQVYQLRSDNGDVTGARITSLDGKNFAVFGGHECVSIKNDACDHLSDQMQPTDTWGTEYVSIPLFGRPYDVIRFLALNNGTQVSINGGPAINLNAGQFADRNISAISHITSNLPISVAQFSVGVMVPPVPANGHGDPFFVMLSPTSQNINEVTFNAFPGSKPTMIHYMNVVAKTADLGTVVFDGVNIGASFTPVPAAPNYSTLRRTITQADHTLKSAQGIQAIVYGYDQYESFGYSAGVRVQVPFLSIYDTTRAYCPSDTVYIALGVSDTSRIIYAEWDLGDGSPHLFDTFNFWHVFPTYGDYPVKFIYELKSACRRDTLIIDTIKIRGPEPDLGGPYNFCVPQMLTINPTYRFPPDSIYWTVGGTTFTTDTNFNYTFYADRDTVIYLKVTSDICDGFDTAYVYVGHDTAGFTVANACEGLPVTFINTSRTVPGSTYNWFWDYGDGTTSIASGATHTHSYAAGGTYTVKLRLQSPNGCSDSITHTVTLYPYPNAAFTASDLCKANVSTPINTSTIASGTMTYAWTFGDNTAIDNSTSPTHSYALSGNYTIKLVASSQGCSDSATQAINVVRGANIAFTAPAVCAGAPTIFTDATTNTYNTTIQNYRWDFGDGNTAATQNTIHTYAAGGTYNAKLVLDYGNSCADSLTQQVTVHAYPVMAFTVNDVCNDSVLTPINTTTGATSYTWNFADGSPSVTGAAPSHTYHGSNQYTVQLIAVGPGNCADTLTNNVRITIGTRMAFTAPAVCQGNATVFTDQTTNPYNTTIASYRWDFADGNTATTQNTTHTYATAGTYAAELLLDYGNNCADSLTQQVTVHPNPVAAFTVSDVCNDSVATPVNTSTGATSYTWNFGDGSADVTGNAPTHTYQASNPYNIQLIAVGVGNCADTVTNPVRVIVGTSIGFNAPAVCEGATTVYTDQTANSYNTTINGYAWDFGDAASAATQNTTHTYATAGTYNVELKLDYGFNCLDSLTKQVVVHTNPVADFTATTPCDATAVQYTDAATSADPIATYTWQFGDGGTSALQNPAHIFNSFGTYNTKQVVYTSNGCSDSITKPVTVLQVGVAQFSVAPVCIGNPSMFYSTIDSVAYPVASYVWDLQETTAGGSQPSHTYSTVGTKAITLIANFANGCADTVTGNAVVNALPVVSAAIKNVSCYGGSDGAVNMTPVSGQPAFIYNWSNTPTNTPNNTNVPIGTYGLTVTDGNTCTVTGSYIVTQPSQLVIDTATSFISCFGYTDGSFTLSPSGAVQPYTFNWSNGFTGEDLVGIGAGTYAVTVTDAQNCTATASATLDDPLLFSIINANDVTIKLGDAAVLNADYENGNVLTWQWSPSNNMSCPTCQSTQVVTYNDMTYTVIAVTDLGCIDTATVKVMVDPKRLAFIPNAFTPNGDGKNDFFEVFGNKEAWKQFEVQVYNRIGEKVYESNDMDFKWDGTYKGVLQNPAVFVYVVKVIYLDNFTDKVYKGTVTLIR